MLGSFIRKFEHRKSGTTRSKIVFGLATGFYPRSLPQNLKLLATSGFTIIEATRVTL